MANQYLVQSGQSECAADRFAWTKDRMWGNWDSVANVDGGEVRDSTLLSGTFLAVLKQAYSLFTQMTYFGSLNSEVFTFFRPRAMGEMPQF